MVCSKALLKKKEKKSVLFGQSIHSKIRKMSKRQKSDNMVFRLRCPECNNEDISMNRYNAAIDYDVCINPETGIIATKEKKVYYVDEYFSCDYCGHQCPHSDSFIVEE